MSGSRKSKRTRRSRGVAGGRSKDKWEVAFHEAGPVVVALALDVPVPYVTVKRTGRSLGRMIPWSASPDAFIGFEQHRAKNPPIMVAGSLAEAKYRFSELVRHLRGSSDVAAAKSSGEPDWLDPEDAEGELFCSEGATSDKENVANTLDMFLGSDLVGAFGRPRAHARDLLDQYWPAVEAIAAELIKETELVDRQVVRIFRKAMRKKECGSRGDSKRDRKTQKQRKVPSLAYRLAGRAVAAYYAGFPMTISLEEGAGTEVPQGCLDTLDPASGCDIMLRGVAAEAIHRGQDIRALVRTGAREDQRAAKSLIRKITEDGQRTAKQMFRASWRRARAFVKRHWDTSPAKRKREC